MAVPSTTEEWFGSQEFQKLVKDFHDRRARYPKEDFDKAKPRHTMIMNEIQSHFQKEKVISKIEFTGSAYEGLKVAATDLEFDVMVVMTGGNKLEKVPVKPGYIKLKPKPGNIDDFKRYQDQDGFLIPDRIISRFFGDLQKYVDNCRAFRKGEVLLRKHGPAVQMDVMNNSGTLWYSVDVVPAYQVQGQPGGQELYVAKPFRDESSGEQPLATWRKSFSLEEKSMFTTIDSGDGCRRQCSRMLKVLVAREPNLKLINSYLIKTSLMHLNRDGKLSWGQGDLGIRLVDLIKALAGHLEAGKLPNYHLPQMNILDRMDKVARQNMSDRLNRILRSKSEFTRILSS